MLLLFFGKIIIITLFPPHVRNIRGTVETIDKFCWSTKIMKFREGDTPLFSNLHSYHYRTIQSPDYESSEHNPTFHISYHVHHSSSHIWLRFQTSLKLLGFLPPLNPKVAVTAILILILIQIKTLSFHCINLYHILSTNWVPKHCLDIFGAQTGSVCQTTTCSRIL